MKKGLLVQVFKWIKKKKKSIQIFQECIHKPSKCLTAGKTCFKDFWAAFMLRIKIRSDQPGWCYKLHVKITVPLQATRHQTQTWLPNQEKGTTLQLWKGSLSSWRCILNSLTSSVWDNSSGAMKLGSSPASTQLWDTVPVSEVHMSYKRHMSHRLVSPPLNRRTDFTRPRRPSKCQRSCE